MEKIREKIVNKTKMYETVSDRRSFHTLCRLSYAHGSARTHDKLKTKQKNWIGVDTRHMELKTRFTYGLNKKNKTVPKRFGVRGRPKTQLSKYQFFSNAASVRGSILLWCSLRGALPQTLAMRSFLIFIFEQNISLYDCQRTAYETPRQVLFKWLNFLHILLHWILLPTVNNNNDSKWN